MSNAEKLHHIGNAILHLREAQLYREAEDLGEEHARLKKIIKDEARKRRSIERKRVLSRDDIEEMAGFGVRFGEVRWLPGTLNAFETDHTLWRSFENLEKLGATRRTRRFGTAVKQIGDPTGVLEAGWMGFLVEIEIAHAEDEYDYVPHWSDYAIETVYVDHMLQAFRLARILRDFRMLEQAKLDRVQIEPRHLWGQYIKHRSRWSLPTDF